MRPCDLLRRGGHVSASTCPHSVVLQDAACNSVTQRPQRRCLSHNIREGCCSNNFHRKLWQVSLARILRRPDVTSSGSADRDVSFLLPRVTVLTAQPSLEPRSRKKRGVSLACTLHNPLFCDVTGRGEAGLSSSPCCATRETRERRKSVRISEATVGPPAPHVQVLGKNL